MKARPANSAERAHWGEIIALGCIVGPGTHCQGKLCVHHCDTGAGGRKDHTKVICLCWGHHQGPHGIHTIGRKLWQQKHGTEIGLMVKTQDLLDMQARKRKGEN